MDDLLGKDPPENKGMLSCQHKQVEGTSEVQMVDGRITRYRKVEAEIRAIIASGPIGDGSLLDEAVNAVSDLVDSPTFLKIVSCGIIIWRNHRKREKMSLVIKNMIRKVFDMSLGWYTMDYQDLRVTCDHIGGPGYFKKEDHRCIYEAIINVLMDGPIRDMCKEKEVVGFVNDKLCYIRDNYIKFKEQVL